MLPRRCVAEKNLSKGGSWFAGLEKSYPTARNSPKSSQEDPREQSLVFACNFAGVTQAADDRGRQDVP